jgi:hypothetical protein
MKRFAALAMLLGFASAGCGGPSSYDASLPNAHELGSPRGYQIARTITHFHSPYSYDACDHHGLSGGKPNAVCLQDLKSALCWNKVNYLFLSDHPDNMQNYEFRDLLLTSDSDTAVKRNGKHVANQVGNCGDGNFSPVIMAGFEANDVMALGMVGHLDSDRVQRQALYGSTTQTVLSRLRKESDALVFVPHTEGKRLEDIQAMKPDGIEIYNFHANVDPKIRDKDLGFPPYEQLSSLLVYMIDPYHQLNPDFAFLSFVKVSPVYGKIWSQLTASGTRVSGIGGSDSHENVFPEEASDGERLDSHRRIMRMMSNHVLVNSLEIDDVKSSLRAGRSWVVFEGLGSPVGMDFYAEFSGQTIGVGDSGALVGSTAKITVKMPHLHAHSPKSDTPATYKIQLKQVLDDGTDRVVATSTNSDLVYETSTPTAYRAEVSVIPGYLKPYLGDFSDQAFSEYTWVITNHLYLTP